VEEWLQRADTLRNEANGPELARVNVSESREIESLLFLYIREALGYESLARLLLQRKTFQRLGILMTIIDLQTFGSYRISLSLSISVLLRFALLELSGYRALGMPS
jgi:hypothetical protein